MQRALKLQRAEEDERPPQVDDYDIEFIEFINKNKGAKATKQNFNSQMSDKIYLFSKIDELTQS